MPVDAGPIKFLEIYRAAEPRDVLWLPSMALVPQSRVPSCPGDPLTFLHSRLLPSPKEAPHTAADRAVDTAGIQVRLCSGR